MERTRELVSVQEALPEMDATLVEIIQGFNFLSEQRCVAIGMSGAIPLSILLTEMSAYYHAFTPPCSLQHFIRVVRSADNEYLSIQSKKSNNKSSSRPPNTGSNGFPSVPTK